MILRQQNISISKCPTITTIRQVTDVHDGSEGHRNDLFGKFLQIQEADKASYWLGTGDMIDADRPSMRDRKKAMYSDRAEAFTQEDKRNLSWLDHKVIPKYERIAKQCIGWLDGDHYLIFSNGMTSGQYICHKLGMPYLGERMAYVRLAFRYNNTCQRCTYDILARHGKGGGSTPGGDVNSLVKQNVGFEFDCAMGGHTHRENCFCTPILSPKRNLSGLKQRIIWYARGGSFLMGFPNGKKATYAEKEEYGPLVTGWVELKLTVAYGDSENNNLSIVESSAQLRAF